MAKPGGGGRPRGKSQHYGLLTLCPVKLGAATGRNTSYESVVRQTLVDLERHEKSPMARVPNTYFARWYVLKDVFFEGRPAKEEHLKSQYLFFASDFHGDLEPYLRGMWANIEADIRKIWAHCVAFDKVDSADDFIEYMKKCQIPNTYLFNGSTDQPLAEQLKGLFLKQEFGDFVAESQGLDDAALQKAFLQFVDEVEVDNLARPTWRAGADTLDNVRID